MYPFVYLSLSLSLSLFLSFSQSLIYKPSFMLPPLTDSLTHALSLSLSLSLFPALTSDKLVYEIFNLTGDPDGISRVDLYAVRACSWRLSLVMTFVCKYTYECFA